MPKLFTVSDGGFLSTEAPFSDPTSGRQKQAEERGYLGIKSPRSSTRPLLRSTGLLCSALRNQSELPSPSLQLLSSVSAGSTCSSHSNALAGPSGLAQRPCLPDQSIKPPPEANDKSQPSAF